MTEEETLEYLRDANSRTDRYAHIVDMDTFEARTADKRDDGEDTVDVYREFSLSDQRTRVQFIENMRRIFSGQSGVLGKYRIRETQTTVIGMGEFVELKQADGTKKSLSAPARHPGGQHEEKLDLPHRICIGGDRSDHVRL